MIRWSRQKLLSINYSREIVMNEERKASVAMVIAVVVGVVLFILACSTTSVLNTYCDDLAMQSCFQAAGSNPDAIRACKAK
jgi:dipeptide/tripeptide permease